MPHPLPQCVLPRFPSEHGVGAAWASLQQRAQQHGASWWPEAVARRLTELQQPGGLTSPHVTVQWSALLSTVQGVSTAAGMAALQPLLSATGCNAAAVAEASQELRQWVSRMHVPASAAPTAAKQRAGVLAACVRQCCEGVGGVEAAWRAAMCLRHLQLQNIDRDARCVHKHKHMCIVGVCSQ